MARPGRKTPPRRDIPADWILLAGSALAGSSGSSACPVAVLAGGTLATGGAAHRAGAACALTGRGIRGVLSALATLTTLAALPALIALAGLTRLAALAALAVLGAGLLAGIRAARLIDALPGLRASLIAAAGGLAARGAARARRPGGRTAIPRR